MTMIEVLVALGVLGVIAGMTLSSIQGAVMTRDLLAEKDSVTQGAGVALSRLSRELQLAYLTTNLAAQGSYRTVFVGVQDEPIDNLWFATLAHKRLYRNSRESDQAEVTIWGERDPENSDAWVLLHREGPRIDHEPDKDGVVLPLAHGVRRLDLRYLDNTTNEWVEEWNSLGVDTPNRLPRAVEILLVLLGPDPEHPNDKSRFVEHPFTTTVILQYAKPLKRSLFAN
jgi:general secretion pathway protein J